MFYYKKFLKSLLNITKYFEGGAPVNQTMLVEMQITLPYALINYIKPLINRVLKYLFSRKAVAKCGTQVDKFVSMIFLVEIITHLLVNIVC